MFDYLRQTQSYDRMFAAHAVLCSFINVKLNVILIFYQATFVMVVDKMWDTYLYVCLLAMYANEPQVFTYVYYVSFATEEIILWFLFSLAQ